MEWTKLGNVWSSVLATGTKLGVAAAITASLFGCQPIDENLDPHEPNMRIYAMPLLSGLDDVAGIQYDIICADGTTVSQYVALEDEALPAWLQPAGGGDQHAFADLLTVLPVGQCTVTATPMQAPGVVSEDCQPLTQIVDVQPEVTTEIVLMLQCEGDPNGALDVVAGLNHPPQITALGLEPSKFVETCEDAIIAPSVVDPNGDAFTLQLTVGQTPAGAIYSLTQLPSGEWVFNASTPGQYELKLVATDIYGATTALTFPLHVSQGSNDACDPEVCCELPDGTTSTVASSDCAAAMGQVVADDLCMPVGEICCAQGELISYLAPGPDCPPDDYQVPMESCDVVCCDVGGAQVQVNRFECDATGAFVSDGACIVEQCCEQPDGTFQTVTDPADCGGAFVQDALCDYSPTCCLLPDNTLQSLSTSECVDQGGAPGDEGCEACMIDPAGTPFFATCDGQVTATNSDLANLVGTVAFKDPNVVTANSVNVGFAATPMFGHVVDTNANGFIDVNDALYMVVLGSRGNSPGRMDLNLVDPNTSALLATQRRVMPMHKPAIVDLDGDGVVEIMGINDQNELFALNYNAATSNFTTVWTSPLAISSGPLAVQPVDVDSDGSVELIVGGEVFDANGVLISTLTTTGAVRGSVAVGDYDLDGIAEVVLSDGVYDPLTGQQEISLAHGSFSTAQFHEVLIQADGDMEAEIARYGAASVEVFDQDGALISTGASNGLAFNIGPACTADFDGDGDSEIAVVFRPPIGTTPPRVRFHDTDGAYLGETILSNVAPSGVSHFSCSAGDLDGDGVAEVLVSAQDFYLIQNPLGTNRAVHRYTHQQNGAPMNASGDNVIPTITDVDRDGQAEIAVSWSPTTPGQSTEVVLYRATPGMADLNPWWQSYDYYTNRLAPSSRPHGAHPLPWLGGELMHAKAAQVSGIDLGVQIDGVCIETCDPGETADISIQVHNPPTGVAVPSGGTIDVAIYANNAGSFSLIGVYPVPVGVPSFNSAAGQLISIPVSAIGADGLIAVVDDDGTGAGVINECREDNNFAFWDANPCD